MRSPVRDTWNALAVTLIIVIGLAAYSNSFEGTFLFDDATPSPRSQRLWPTWETLATPRAVVQLSLSLNYLLGGTKVWGYHAFNLAVHILAALALFGIVRHAMRSAECGARNAENGRSAIPHSEFRNSHSAIALAIALIWLAHPLQTESVTYIVQRAESLMGLSYLLTVYCAIRSFFSPRPRPWQALAVAACALGMISKPVMVSAPIMVLLYDLIFVNPSVQNPKSRSTFLTARSRSKGKIQDLKSKIQNRFPLYAGLAATWLLLIGVTVGGPPARSAGFGMENLTSWQYARSQPGVILHYLRLSFWPGPLCLDYLWPVARTAREIAPPAIAVLALVGGTAWALWRHPPLGFLGLWFFLILAPTSSVMPIADLCFEHRMYLPLAAVVALGVTGACALGGRALKAVVPEGSRARLGWTIGGAAALLIIGAFAYLTFLRNTYYADELTMWQDVARKRPLSWRAYYNLGTVLRDRKMSDRAIPVLTQSVWLRPTGPETHNNLGLALADVGRLEDAVTHFKIALELKRDYPMAHANLGRTLCRMGRLDEGVSHFLAALRLSPKDATTQSDFGNALAALARTDEALIHYREAIRLKPDFMEAHYNLARALAAQGKLDDAIARYGVVLKLAPDYAEAHNNLARLLAMRGRPAEALAHYRQALRQMPDSPVVLMNLAWLRAANGNPEFRDAAEALSLAKRAYEETGPENFRALDVLAAAHAEAGQFDKAAELAKKALELASAARQKDQEREIEKRLELYRAGKPYREEAP